MTIKDKVFENLDNAYLNGFDLESMRDDDIVCELCNMTDDFDHEKECVEIMDAIKEWKKDHGFEI